jgi:hypothetical protein
MGERSFTPSLWFCHASRHLGIDWWRGISFIANGIGFPSQA